MHRIERYMTDSLSKIYSQRELHTLTTLICREVLHLPLSDVYAGKGTHLSEQEWQLFKDVVARLQSYEPIQYILGSTTFHGMTFRLKPGVLIPRPETEELVELILKESEGKERVLDIGTGSGCIAITLAKKIEESVVEAWDISPEALEIAKQNGRELDADVYFRKVNVFECQPTEVGIYDIIVSNPPYVTQKEKADMDRNVLDWEPDVALFVADDDPLIFYRRIVFLAWCILRSYGKLYLEINPAYGKEVADLLAGYGFKNIKIEKDLFNKNRFIIADR